MLIFVILSFQLEKQFMFMIIKLTKFGFVAEFPRNISYHKTFMIFGRKIQIYEKQAPANTALGLPNFYTANKDTLR